MTTIRAKNTNRPRRFKTLSEAMSQSGFPPPQHPLIALVNAVDHSYPFKPPLHEQMLSFYKISYRLNAGGRISYGQTKFDYREGGLFFAAPMQTIGTTAEDLALEISRQEDGSEDTQPATDVMCGQITILIHPDFLKNYPLASKIKKYNFFSYTVNEALWLSEKEKEVILTLLRTIEDELNHPIDEISQDIIIAQLELFLNYAQRFYKRQFITRRPVSETTVAAAREILEVYFQETSQGNHGLPSVHYLANRLHISASYLSDLLRSATGLNAQQFIHEMLIQAAKEQLLGTSLTVSEIAYRLGFEHPQSFSKLFKLKTSQTPKAYRLAKG